MPKGHRDQFPLIDFIRLLLSPMLQGETLYHDVGSGIIISNQSLVVQRVTRSDSGRYTCHVFNSEGEGVSEEVSLSVKCKT